MKRSPGRAVALAERVAREALRRARHITKTEPYRDGGRHTRASLPMRKIAALHATRAQRKREKYQFSELRPTESESAGRLMFGHWQPPVQRLDGNGEKGVAPCFDRLSVTDPTLDYRRFDLDKATLKPFLKRLEANTAEAVKATEAALPLERKGRELDDRIREAHANLARAAAAAEALRNAGAAQLLDEISEQEWSQVHEAAQFANVAAKGATDTIAEATKAKATLLERLDKLQVRQRELLAERRQIHIDMVAAMAAPALVAADAAETALHASLQDAAALSELLRCLGGTGIGYNAKATNVLQVPRFGNSEPAKAIYAPDVRSVTAKLRDALIAEGFEIPDLRILDQAVPAAMVANPATYTVRIN